MPGSNVGAHQQSPSTAVQLSAHPAEGSLGTAHSVSAQPTQASVALVPLLALQKSPAMQSPWPVQSCAGAGSSGRSKSSAAGRPIVEQLLPS